MLSRVRHFCRPLLSASCRAPRVYYRPASAIAAASCVRTKAPPLSVPTEVRLREYQEECIQSVLSHLKQNHKRLGISLATGSGKTVIFTQLIDRVPEPNQHATKTLILVHRRELVEQAARHCIAAYPSKTVEVEMGNAHATGAANITVASIQSITSRERINKFDPDTYKLILVDEAHHIVAPNYLNALAHFGLRHGASGPAALVGVSATLSRHDGLRLGSVIDHIVYHKDYVDMIADKWLSDVVFTTVDSKVNLNNVGMRGGDFQVGALSKAVNTDEANEITVRAWLARATGRKSTLVFCADLDHVSGLTAMFRRHGIDARSVMGDTHKRIRSERLNAFKNGEYPVLLNCGVFTEGTDIPNIDCVLLARPTKSRNLLVQMIGRGMRLSPAKENCHVIDMVASLETGIVTTPTLFGLDPSELVRNASVSDLRDLKDRKERDKKSEGQALAAAASEAAALQSSDLSQVGRLSATITFTDYESVNDLIEDTSGERFVRVISPNAWTAVGDHRFVLTGNTGNYLDLERDGDRFVVRYYARMFGDAKSKSTYMRPRQVASAETFEDAVHAADTFASTTFPYVAIAHNQYWRRKPASPAQLAFLNKYRDEDDQLTADSITKGRAGDMITKMRHGAKGRFNKLAVMKRKGQRETQRLEHMKRREEVKVGPTMQEWLRESERAAAINHADAVP